MDVAFQQEHCRDLIVESLLLFIIVFHIYSIIDIWEVIQWLASFHKDMNDKKGKMVICRLAFKWHVERTLNSNGGGDLV